MVLFKNNTFYITAGKEFDLLNHCRPRKMSKIKFIASGADPGFIKKASNFSKGDGDGRGGEGWGLVTPENYTSIGHAISDTTPICVFDASPLSVKMLPFLYQNIAVIRQSDRRSWILAMLKVVNFIYKKICQIDPPRFPECKNF